MLFLITHMYVCLYGVHMSAGALGGKKSTLDLLELELQAAVGCPMSVWGPHLCLVEEPQALVTPKSSLHPIKHS